MAAASINVNLTTISDADNDPAAFVRVGAGGQITGDSDIYIQLTPGSTTFAEVTTIPTSTVLIAYNNGSTITFDSRDHLFAWAFYSAPAKLQTTANGGQIIGFGNNTTVGQYDLFYVGGNEPEYLTGGWRCLVASPNQTPQQDGATSAPYQYFAAGGTGLENVGKDNFLLDVIRYGRGLQLVDGDSTNPGTMKSFTDVNDSLANQYGVIRAGGAGASFQGEVSIGHTDATSTETYFSDSNFALSTPNKNPLSGSSQYATLETFTGVRILGSATTCIFTNFTFSSSDNYDRGYLSADASYPVTYGSGTEPLTLDIDGCAFTDWGETHLSSNTTITNTTWVNCSPIVLNSGVIENCTVETGVGGTYVFSGSTPNNISNTSFIGGGTGGGHGFEVNQGGEYSFTGNTFSNFGLSDTNDAAVHINGGATGIAVTFNITGGGDGSFTYKLTGAGSTVTFVSAVTVNITGLPIVPTGNGTEIRILESGTTTEIVGVGTENHRTSTYTFTISTGTVIDVRILNLDYVPLFISNITANTNPTNIPVDLKVDRVYQDDTPPSGE